MEYITVEGQKYPVLSKQTSKFQTANIYFFEIPNGDVSLVVDGKELSGTISRFGETASLTLEEAMVLLESIEKESENSMYGEATNVMNILQRVTESKEAFNFLLNDSNCPAWVSNFNRSDIMATTTYALFKDKFKDFVFSECFNISRQFTNKVDVDDVIAEADLDPDPAGAIASYLDVCPESFISDEDAITMAKELIGANPDRFTIPIANYINANFYGIISTEDGDIIDPSNLNKFVLSTIFLNDPIDIEELVSGHISTTDVVDLILQKLILFDDYDDYVKRFGETPEYMNLPLHEAKEEISQYISSKKLFNRSSVEAYYVCSGKKVLTAIASTKELFNEIFIENTVDILDVTNDLIPMTSEELTEFLDDHVKELQDKTFNDIKPTFAKVLGPDIVDYDLDTILTTHLSGSLQSFLVNNYLPEKFIKHTPLQNIIDSFSEREDVKKAYKAEDNPGPFIMWLGRNLPYENLNECYWSKYLDKIQDKYFEEVAIRILSETTGEVTFVDVLRSVKQNPALALRVFEGSLEPEIFVKKLILEQ